MYVPFLRSAGTFSGSASGSDASTGGGGRLIVAAGGVGTRRGCFQRRRGCADHRGGPRRFLRSLFGRSIIAAGFRDRARLDELRRLRRADDLRPCLRWHAHRRGFLGGLVEMLLQHLLTLLVAPLLLPPFAHPAEHGAPAIARELRDGGKQPAERELRRQDDGQEEERQNQDDRARAVEVFREPAGEPVPHVSARAKRLARHDQRAERERQEGRDAREEQPGADELRVRGVEGAAPEVVPAEHDHDDRNEVRGVPEHLVRQLGHERADPPGEIRRRDDPIPVLKNQTGSDVL